MTNMNTYHCVEKSDGTIVCTPAKEPPSSGSERRLVLPGFEYEETQLQFACTHSIYTKEGQSSICYVTSEERAKIMVAALNHFKATGAMDEYLRPNVPAMARPAGD